MSFWDLLTADRVCDYRSPRVSVVCAILLVFKSSLCSSFG